MFEMRFSERIGVREPLRLLQVGNMNPSLRNAIWNAIAPFLPEVQSYSPSHDQYLSVYYRHIWTGFLKLKIDDTPDTCWSCRSQLLIRFDKWDWMDVYDFLEFMVVNFLPDGAEVSINEVLASERSGYRFIEKTLAPIIDETEIAAISRVVECPDIFSGARTHMTTAVGLFSMKVDPDYRNAIKEAVSAVESAAKVIAGSESATLSTAIKLIDGSLGLHPAFRDAVLKFYGWTSDEKGVRHSLLDEESTIDEADAHFAIVNCAGIVNFLIAKHVQRSFLGKAI